MSIEKTAIALDEIRQKRKSLLVPQIDFEAFMLARQEDRAAIKSPLDFRDEVVEYFDHGSSLQGARLPWEKTHEVIRFRPGEVTCWHGYNGHGKSELLGQVFNHFAIQGEKGCIASFEMHPYKTLARMTRQILGANQPDISFIDKYFNWANGKLWLYDQLGTVSGSRVIAVIHYVAETFGIQHFAIDSLMKCGIDTDTSHSTWTAQKNFVDQLCATAKTTNCHIHLIAHDRKPDDESVKPHKYMIAGSGDISNQVDNCLGIWRNKRKEQEQLSESNEEDATIICDKQRNGEWEGDIKLWFDQKSLRFIGHQGEKIWPMLK